MNVARRSTWSIAPSRLAAVALLLGGAASAPRADAGCPTMQIQNFQAFNYQPGPGLVSLTWDPLPGGPFQYEVYRKEWPGYCNIDFSGTFGYVGVFAAPTTQAIGVPLPTPNVAYIFVAVVRDPVDGLCGATKTPYLYEGLDRFTAPPGPPALSGSVTGDDIDLHWVVPDDRTFEMLLERSVGGGPWQKLLSDSDPAYRCPPGTPKTYQDGDLSPGVYSYRITGRNGGSNLAPNFSNVVTLAVCDIDVVPDSANVPSAGGSGTFLVAAAPGCPWTAVSSAPWLVANPPAGTGPQPVTYTYEPNPSPVGRNASIAVDGASFDLHQAGVSCGVQLTPSSLRFPAAGGNDTLLVQDLPGCNWSATTGDSWLTILSGATGSGNGAIVVRASENTASAPRSGAVSVGGVTASVTQAGTDPCQPLPPPVLLEPAAGATRVSLSPTLVWSAVEGATHYDLHLGAAANPAAVASGLTGTSYQASNLAAETTYFWKVTAKGNAGPCPAPPVASSAVATFQTGSSECEEPGDFATLFPADGASGVPTSVTFTWQAAPGAATYDLYLGPDEVPDLEAEGLTGTSYTATGLAPGSTYFWGVVARAACDDAFTEETEVASFLVAGSCAAPGPFSLSLPADAATLPLGQAVLSWTPSPNAAEYDLHLGDSADPPLVLPGLNETSIELPDLDPGVTYHWKVVARASCGTEPTLASAERSFSISDACVAPAAPAVTEAPAGPVDQGDTYVVSWSEVPGLDVPGAYVVERALNASFSPLVDRQVIPAGETSASFDTPQAGTFHHRVYAVAACDPTKVSPVSSARTVAVTGGLPNVVFTVLPSAVLVPKDAPLAGYETSLTLENIGPSSVDVALVASFVDSPPFFTLVDPLGGDAARLTLAPRLPKTLKVRFEGPSTATPGAFQGLVYAAKAAAASPDLAVAPYAAVSLRVGAAATTAGALQFVEGTTPIDAVSFPGFAGDDATRPALSVGLKNTGPTPVDVAAEIGPELWLAPETGWNATPLAAGETRTLRLFTRRARAASGAAFPRYTYLTVRSSGGAAARLLVQDNDVSRVQPGRLSPPRPGDRAVIVPSLAHATSALGNTFVSRLILSNVGSEPAPAELLFTPAGRDGLDPTAVKRAVVTVPPNDVVTLVDPLVRLFGLTPPISGPLEVRAASDRLASLSTASTLDAPVRGGGAFGLSIPTLLRGDGARVGRPHVLGGISATATQRTNVILVETTGLDGARVKLTVYDGAGTARGEMRVNVPRGSHLQVNNVVAQVATPAVLPSGHVEIAVESGAGAVVGVATVLDNNNDDATTYVSRTAEPRAGGARRAAYGAAHDGAAPAATTFRSIVPAVVNGFPTFPAADRPFTFQSLLGFTSLTGVPATFTVTYVDVWSGGTRTTKTITVPARQTVEYPNALEQLFGVVPGARSHGYVEAESTTNGLLYCRVYSKTDTGTLGDSFPVLPIPSESLTGAGSSTPLYVDGLEQSLDPGVGSRSNLILNEVTGQPATVRVKLYEAGNRSDPIAETELTLQPKEKLQLSTVFAGLGLDAPDRRKDRTNVLLSVSAAPGSAGLVSAFVTTIDAKTGDVKVRLLAPNGGTSASGGGGTIGF